MDTQLNFTKAIKMFFILILLTSTVQLEAKCTYTSALKIKALEVGNILSWSTTQEKDLKYFIVQKSLDGIEFKKVGKVKGAGTSNKRNLYRFLDLGLPTAKVYYRLVHYTSSDDYAMSETFCLEQFRDDDLKIVSMSSAVTDDQLEIKVATKTEGNLIYKIKNRKGQIVQTGIQSLEVGNNIVAFQCKKFKEGDYDVELTAKGGVPEQIAIRKVNSEEMHGLDYSFSEK